MEVTISKTITDTIEVIVPSFYSSHLGYSKITEEGTLIQVRKGLIGTWKKDEMFTSENIMKVIAESEQCPEDAFIKAFEEQMAELRQSINPVKSHS